MALSRALLNNKTWLTKGLRMTEVCARSVVDWGEKMREEASPIKVKNKRQQPEPKPIPERNKNKANNNKKAPDYYGINQIFGTNVEYDENVSLVRAAPLRTKTRLQEQAEEQLQEEQRQEEVEETGEEKQEAAARPRPLEMIKKLFRMNSNKVKERKERESTKVLEKPPDFRLLLKKQPKANKLKGDNLIVKLPASDRLQVTVNADENSQRKKNELMKGGFVFQPATKYPSTIRPYVTRKKYKMDIFNSKIRNKNRNE